MVCQRLYNVELQTLAEKGIKHLLLDLDNTLTKWKDFDIDERISAWVQSAKEIGMKPCIVSNSNGDRAMIVAEALGIDYIKNAAKPYGTGIQRAMDMYGATKADTAMIGDQLFTDVKGGIRNGIFTVLLEPINKREFIYTKCVRIFERRAIKKLGIR
jgi:HAD superfamily phosphatase (TIGR01668 family)